MLLRKIILLVLIITIVLPITHQEIGLADDGNDLPPQVIDVYPFPGTEMSGQTPLIISFDQPMNHSSVEQAFGLEPLLAGRLTWPDNRTLEFAPNTTWASNQNYEMTITTDALSARDLALPEDYHASLKGSTDLVIAEFSPAHGATHIETDATIMVSFNRPMIPLSTVDVIEDLLSPLHIEPEIAGTGQWLNTALYQFTPDEALFGGTTYEITIEAGLKSVDGIELAEDFAWSFETQNPRIEYIYPIWSSNYYYYRKPVPLDSPFEIVFSQAMDHETTEAAFGLYHWFYDENEEYEYEQVSGNYTWSEDSKIMTFTPDDLLLINDELQCCNYEIDIKPTARTLYGDGVLAEEFDQRFTTVSLPGVNQITPQYDYNWQEGEDWQPGDYPVISFKTSMDIDTLAGRIIIDPEPKNWHPFTWNDYYGRDDGKNISSTLYLVYSSQAETTYTITILAGAEDPYGNTIDEDYTFTYTTEEQAKSAQMISMYSLYSWGSRFRYTSAYREDTAFPLSISGTPTLTFELYDLTLENVFLDRVVNATTYTYDLPDDQLRRSWQVSPGDKTYVNRTVSIPLVSDEGGHLPPGIYGLEIHGLKSTYRTERPSSRPLVVATANITTKRTPAGLLVWVTDIESGEPLAHTPLTIYDYELNIYAEVETDEDGIAQIEADLCDDMGQEDYWDSCTGRSTVFIVVLDHNGQFSITESDGEPPVHTQRATLYTDRPIYRPGDTVYFRGAYFKQNDMHYSVPTDETIVEVEARLNYRTTSYETQIIYNEELALTEFGTFSGEIQLPDDIPLGEVTLYINGTEYNGQMYPLEVYGTLQSFFENYRLPDEFYYYGMEYRIYSPSVKFTIADYRTFDYEIETTASQDEIVQGDPLEIDVQAQYYSGEPLSGAEISYRYGGCLYYFDYKGAGDYRFYDEDWYNIYYYYLGYPNRYRDGSCRLFAISPEIDVDQINDQFGIPHITDINGHAVLDIQSTTYPNRQPTLIAVSAFANDENRNYVSSQSLVVAHPANIYPGITSDNYSIELGESIAYDLIAVTPDSDPIPNQTLTLTIDRITWQRIPRGSHYASYDWQKLETPVDTIELTTDELGRANYTFTPEEAGSYRARTVVVDADGHTNSSTYRTYVRAYGWSSWWQPVNEDYQEIIPDKETYTPGETAHILIPLPTDGKSTVLISIERAEVMHYDVIQAEGSTLWYDLPITDEFAPTIFVNVSVIMPPDDQVSYTRFNYGIKPIQIEPTPYRLNVELTPDTDQASPGDTVTINIQVTDKDGNLVQAEVGLKMTDAAILDLMSDNNQTLEEAFYGPQWLHILTRNTLEYLIDRFLAEAEDPQPGGMGGGPGPHTLDVRDDFQDTPLWEPHIVTNENGFATASVTLPDNLTRWEIEARALTQNALVGQATTSITSTRPLIVRPIAPRFFTVDDHVMLSTTVHNNTDSEQVVTVCLDAEGVILDDSVEQIITLAAHSHERVDWWATVEDVGFVSLVFSAETETGYQDAAIPTLTAGSDQTIPVYRYTRHSIYSTGGLITEDGTVIEGVSIPSRLADKIDGELVVNIEPSIAVTTIDSLDYLNQYPHYCVEQTTSRLLPNIVTHRVLQELDISDPVLAQNLLENIDKAHTKLKDEQREGGGWGWFYNITDTDIYVTAYATYALLIAQDAGYEVDEEMLEKALDRLSTYVTRHRAYSPYPDWSLNQLVFLNFVLSQADEAKLEHLDKLMEERNRLSYQNQAYLTLAYSDQFPNSPNITILVDELKNGATLSGQLAYWDDDPDWYNWTTSTRSTAVVLDALVALDPTSNLLPMAVRWLMLARQSDHWETTQETAWSILALTNWMLMTGELQPNYTYTVRLNGENWVTQAISPVDVRDQQTLRTDVANLILDDVNRLEISRAAGDGALYYSSYLNIALPAEDAVATQQGVAVTREYFSVDGLNEYDQSEDEDAVQTESITTAQVGDVITVRLTFNLTQDMHYFVLEDPIPSGTEIVNTNLLTAPTNATGESFVRSYQWSTYQWWYWGWWWIDRTELRDNGAYLYADYLPAGTYTYSYQIQASLPGEFQTRSSYAYAFYYPDVYGTSAGFIFTVNE